MRTSRLCPGIQLDEVVLAADRGSIGGALSPGRYSLTLEPIIDDLMTSISRRARCAATRSVGSPLPAHLTALGYIVTKTGESERILPHAVAQRFEMSSSGGLVAVTEGSTKPVASTVTHAGITKVEAFEAIAP
jgi:hypothetical protein